MPTAFHTHLIKIGNSQGIRIPKALLAQAHLTGEVELVVGEGQIVVRPSRHPRAGWAEAFREMAELGDDRLLDSEAARPSDWDETEWQW